LLRTILGALIMTKRALLAATAVTSVLASSLISTPAMANQSPYTVEQSAAFADPQAVCEDQLNPNEHSGYQTEAINFSTNTVNGPDVVDDDPYQQVGTGTPTFTGISFGTHFHRNGGSPNIWVDGTAEQEIWPTSDLYYHTHHTETTITTFDCDAYKIVPGTGERIDPNGLSSQGNQMATDVQENVPGPDYIDHNGGPYTDPETGIALDNILICISPNNTTKSKPGTWTGKHGYLSADCPYAAAHVDSNWVPSGNAPDLP
jgi:hypothetical protein